MRHAIRPKEPPLWSNRLYLRLPRPEIAYVKFILESYDNLAFMSVVDRFEALLCLTFSPNQEQEVRELVARLEREIELRELPVPIKKTQEPISK
ncbi:MAG: DUF4911 domain-containing protein [Desulfohalobiaceae bacterium]|nr:DUF4911 domain-containing protein [Desulfohalobiaceae bacterium]